MKHWLPKHWYARSPWLFFFAPLSWIYQLLHFFRRFAYHIGLLQTTKFKIPVIVVGNITVGGTGKTPLVMHLVKELKQAGFRPGIVSRGYGGHAAHYPCRVDAQSKAQEVGDEALELFFNTDVPMIVDPNRPRAIHALLKLNSVNVVISDDGLQHTALKPSFTIGVVDGARRFGNGLCLPAGPNRESPKRWQQLDLRVCHGDAKENEWHMELKPTGFVQLTTKQNQDLSFFARQTVHAVTGIGHPERFIQTLEKLNINVIPHVFPDHHLFSSGDFQFADELPIVMTGKDAVKCRDFAGNNWWYLQVEVVCDAEIDRSVIRHVATKTLAAAK